MKKYWQLLSTLVISLLFCQMASAQINNNPTSPTANNPNNPNNLADPNDLNNPK